MKKRILMLVLVLAALLSLVVFTAQAAEVPADVEWIELSSKEDFLEWFGNAGNAKNLTENYTAGMTRYYKLTDDITIDQDSTVYYLSSSTYEVNTYIDLNGHTLTYASPKETGATRLFGSYNEKTTTTVVNGTIDNRSNITGSNGGLFLMNKGKLYMEDVVINDKADIAYTVSGKVISAVGYDVTLINVDITTGSTANHNYALAVRCENATLTMTGCNFTSTATARAASGGLVYQVNGTLNITDCTFNGGYGKLGGNVYAKGAAVTIANSTFTNGRSIAGGQGADLAIYDSAATITNCTFQNTGSTTPDFGGSVFFQTSKAVTMQDCTITGGRAKYGGAFYSVNAALTMENCAISGGVATVEGGNAQIKNGKATLTNVTVTGGKATESGGNISVANSGTVNFVSGTISGGSAKNGGNIATAIASSTGCTLNFKGVTVSGGTASNNGGNVYAVAVAGYAGKPTISFTSGTITGGVAGGSGGNFYLMGLAKEAATADKAAIAERLVKFTMTGGTMGGAVAEGKKYSGEAATGGNLFATYATVSISGGEVSNGHASDLAGNLYPSAACTMTISGTALVSGGIASARGGNFYMSSTNTVLNIQGGTVQNGKAYQQGGNIYHGNGKLNITGGVITGGYSESSGGNIYAGMGYGNNKLYCGTITIKDDGNPDTPLAQITNGTAVVDGGNIYFDCSGNALDTGYNKVVLGNFQVSGGTAKGNGDNIFLKAHAVLEILPEFTQEIPCYLGYAAKNSMMPENLPGNALVNNRGISTGDFTGKLYFENYDNIFLYAKDGTLYFAGAAVVAETGTKTWYTTNEAAVANYAGGAYLQAAPGTLELLGGEYVVDLAGNQVAIIGGGTVTLFDSANDDFDGFGSATLEGVTLANTKLTRVFYKDYYTLEQEGAYSFHRIEARLTNVSIRPSAAGIYFTAQWSCDDTVKPYIGTFGVAVSMENYPGTDFVNDKTALYTTFTADSFESGVQKTGAMVAGILKSMDDGVTQERVAMNSVYAQMAIFAEAYITIDGVTYTGLGASYSMYDILKIISDNINVYYTQADAMADFMTKWGAEGLAGEPWSSLNFQVSEDVLLLNNLYAGMQPYYGELHDHAATGGTSDGKQTLDVWMTEMARLQMDFATIVDHKQSAHMYLDQWDNSMFIGGSEAACTITDRNGVKLHYNMIFADPAGLEAVVSAFPEFKWQYYPEDYTGTNAEKLAGGWHFSYPNFTAARFTEVCQAVYANGGFVAIVHPKSSGYISSNDPADAYFMDGIGMEVFYTYFSTRDGWKTKANHKLWTNMLKAGYRVYATAGNDEHDMPSDKAVSVVYATQRGASSWVETLRTGNFVAGGVAIRSAMGDVMMGGSTAFQGKRFTFSVGGFHNSLFDKNHVYRVDVLDQNGVVFSREISANETSYFAFDANNESNYYYIEIYDVTEDSMIAIGNPIWNDR